VVPGARKKVPLPEFHRQRGGKTCRWGWVTEPKFGANQKRERGSPWLKTTKRLASEQLGGNIGGTGKTELPLTEQVKPGLWWGNFGRGGEAGGGTTEQRQLRRENSQAKGQRPGERTERSPGNKNKARVSGF